MISIIKKTRDDNEVFILSDGEKICAECVFSFENAEILDITVFDGEDIFAENVLRAAMSSLDIAGKTVVTSKKSELGKLFSKLGFDEKDGVFTIITTNIFKPCDETDVI